MNTAICTNEEIYKFKRTFPKTCFYENQRMLLKAVLVTYLHRIFSDLFISKIQISSDELLMECYAMDNKIMQHLIQRIVDSGNYTLEGVAYHTRIPFDVIYNAVTEISNDISVTPWARVVDLYLEVYPDIAKILVDKLLETRNKNDAAFSLLLKENC